MRKILIATPLRGDLPAAYLNTLFRVMGSRTPGISFGYAFIGATSVQWARDEAVQMARDKQCTEIIFWDKDLEPSIEHWQRLVSHETQEIVCSLYAKRDPLTHWHATFIDGKEPDMNGIVEVHQAAVGFSKIKMSAFDNLRTAYPDRAYTINNAGMPPQKLHEYFPMERVGFNTDSGKIQRIKALLKPGAVIPDHITNFLISEIVSVLQDSDYSSNQMHGEDYSFCRLARAAGIPIHVDTQLIIPHTGECRFPIPTALLEEMAKEEWRKEVVSQ